MKFELANKKLRQIKADCEVIFIIKKKLKHKWVKDEKLLKNVGYRGEAEEVKFLEHQKRLYVGISSLSSDDLRIGAALAVQSLRKTRYKSLKLGLYSGQDELANFKALMEGFSLSCYSFDKYKSKKDKFSINKIIFANEDYENKKVSLGDFKNIINNVQTITEAVNLTRDIVNEIPAEINPVTLSKQAKEIAKESGLKIKIYGEDYLKKEGMGAFLAVSQASPFPPQLIHLEYRADKPRVKIVLVGKGLTYDSGGLSLKPSEVMVTMKSDKSGASAILGIMQALAKLKLPVEVHGVIGATENMVGQHAYKPDDILIAKNKKSIEVRNTDAEGRLVLADCLVYAQELKPDYIIDLATLTGAVMVALGRYTIGVMGHNENLIGNIIKAGEISGELAAYLPFNRHLPKLIESKVADMRNTSTSKYGGAITAGLFLSEFIDKKYKDKWIHLDISGPSYIEKSWGYNPLGASGSGVRLILEWMGNLAKEEKN